ncbi:hypothetical protein LOTGIDRAFT_167850 [Lottia gigantea]|uniref:Uncharacterized protein n=1 Tax=Lottia gigantea TaxID=225164 RepID=V3Z3Q6_LOTGI|nr:hypothetical protein LOTGIDRAFT_167850 [Lottia gigantea]ESO85278.1 hypothetical protein LOTGIDRAFT_167850 [Lottia gigantea]
MGKNTFVAIRNPFDKSQEIVIYPHIGKRERPNLEGEDLRLCKFAKFFCGKANKTNVRPHRDSVIAAFCQLPGGAISTRSQCASSASQLGVDPQLTGHCSTGSSKTRNSKSSASHPGASMTPETASSSLKDKPILVDKENMDKKPPRKLWVRIFEKMWIIPKEDSVTDETEKMSSSAIQATKENLETKPQTPRVFREVKVASVPGKEKKKKQKIGIRAPVRFVETVETRPLREFDPASVANTSDKEDAICERSVSEVIPSSSSKRNLSKLDERDNVLSTFSGNNTSVIVINSVSTQDDRGREGIRKVENRMKQRGESVAGTKGTESATGKRSRRPAIKRREVFKRPDILAVTNEDTSEIYFSSDDDTLSNKRDIKKIVSNCDQLSQAPLDQTPTNGRNNDLPEGNEQDLCAKFGKLIRDFKRDFRAIVNNPQGRGPSERAHNYGDSSEEESSAITVATTISINSELASSSPVSEGETVLPISSSRLSNQDLLYSVRHSLNTSCNARDLPAPSRRHNGKNITTNKNQNIRKYPRELPMPPSFNFSRHRKLRIPPSKRRELPIPLSKQRELPIPPSKLRELPIPSSKHRELPTPPGKHRELPISSRSHRELPIPSRRQGKCSPLMNFTSLQCPKSTPQQCNMLFPSEMSLYAPQQRQVRVPECRSAFSRTPLEKQARYHRVKT